jgi:hypothetical protein
MLLIFNTYKINKPIRINQVVGCFFTYTQTLALWLVADFEERNYQVILNFDKGEYIETGTATAINYSECCAFVFF